MNTVRSEKLLGGTFQPLHAGLMVLFSRLMGARSGVCIFYSRSDGSDYAAWLREKLQKEHPDIPLWQDIISERAGRDWWLQITDALDHVAYMVMLATPDCLHRQAC